MDPPRTSHGVKDGLLLDPAASCAEAPSNNTDSSSSSTTSAALFSPTTQALFAGGASPEEALAASAEGLWRGYLCGQLVNVTKAALWWSSFGVLSVSLLGNPLGVGVLRGAFNMALVLLSPLASAAAERISMWRLLLVTTASRWFIWSVAVPAAWLWLFVYLDRPLVFWGVAGTLVFLDGAHVAFANVVDMDCGGLDSLAAQTGIPIWESLRERFNKLHRITFDVSFILFTPPVALLMVALVPLCPLPAPLADLLSMHKGLHQRVGLIGSQAVVFGALSCLSLCFYICGRPSRRGISFGRGNAAGSLPQEGINASRHGGTEWEGAPGGSLCSEDSFTECSGESEAPSLCRETVLRIAEIKEGCSAVLSNRPLAWRVLFLAMETALEDAVVSVVLPLLSLYTPQLFAATPGDALTANAWAAALIAAGKAGGCLTGAVMGPFWRTPEAPTRRSRYKALFWSVFASVAALLLIPGALLLHEMGVLRWCCILMIFVSSFLFFACSAAPKMGFAALLQGLVSSQQLACKVFGFVGVFVTVVDAVVILSINALFACLLPKGPLIATAAVCLFFLIHGLLEATLGPFLVLEGQENEDEVERALERDAGALRQPYNNPTHLDRHAVGGHTPQQMEAFVHRDRSAPSTACTST
ncbi:uncharacterized protein LOC34618533 [Cyclospora cayetanensis]|uniref:Uncharacterized protein LOC34618533 n=1 Tax=Cyclospora cayetanensis TaxID=88456 RepID=A0A6P6RY13_9EIME|nr:uncharacterized protein LOC34618533 [Cyclospora cayetanensis]